MLRATITMLIVLAMLGVVSAISGIQSVHSDAAVGTVVTYHHGLGRLYALGFSAVCLALMYAIYRRHIVAWWIGFIGWVAAAAQMIFMIWRDISRTGGLWSALAASIAVVAVAAFWSHRWYLQRSYFA